VRPKKLKVYPLENLLDRFESIKLRCERIENISREFAFVPQTTITMDDRELRYEQDLVVRKSLGLIDDAEKVQVLERFADDLEALRQRRFVHGDIHSGNIIYDGCRLNLIDFEPSLRQVRKGRKVIVSTSSVRSFNDKTRGKISHEADKIGFYRCASKILVGRSDRPMLSIEEAELVGMEYREILGVLTHKLVACEST
jgi:hypothetical protein